MTDFNSFKSPENQEQNSTGWEDVDDYSPENIEKNIERIKQENLDSLTERGVRQEIIASGILNNVEDFQTLLSEDSEVFEKAIQVENGKISFDVLGEKTNERLSDFIERQHQALKAYEVEMCSNGNILVSIENISSDTTTDYKNMTGTVISQVDTRKELYGESGFMSGLTIKHDVNIQKGKGGQSTYFRNPISLKKNGYHRNTLSEDYRMEAWRSEDNPNFVEGKVFGYIPGADLGGYENKVGAEFSTDQVIVYNNGRFDITNVGPTTALQQAINEERLNKSK